MLVDGVDDLDEFQTRKRYILTHEHNLSYVIDYISNVVRNKELCAKIMHQVGMALKENLDTKDETHHSDEIVIEFRKKLVEFYDFCGKCKVITAQQVREDIWYFGDVFLEYKNIADSLKVFATIVYCITNPLKRIMNYRTDALIEYVETIKFRTKTYEKLLKAKSLNFGKTPEVIQLEQQLKDCETEISQKRSVFEKSKIEVTREMVRFEKEKVKDYRNALRDYAQTQIRYEKQKLGAAESLLREWQRDH
jgi:hypothetical protein